MPQPTTTPGPGSTGAGAPKGRAPHRRNEQARIAVLRAADDLLAERGYAGVTIEGIAARAGVAKQTIYRWWSSKVEVLMDCLIDDAQQEMPAVDHGSLTADLRHHLTALADFLATAAAGRVLVALIAEAQHDERAAEQLRR